jgi:hypothetical protein
VAIFAAEHQREVSMRLPWISDVEILHRLVLQKSTSLSPWQAPRGLKADSHMLPRTKIGPQSAVPA